MRTGYWLHRLATNAQILALMMSAAADSCTCVKDILTWFLHSGQKRKGRLLCLFTSACRPADVFGEMHQFLEIKQWGYRVDMVQCKIMCIKTSTRGIPFLNKK